MHYHLERLGARDACGEPATDAPLAKTGKSKPETTTEQESTGATRPWISAAGPQACLEHAQTRFVACKAFDHNQARSRTRVICGQSHFNPNFLQPAVVWRKPKIFPSVVQKQPGEKLALCCLRFLLPCCELLDSPPRVSSVECARKGVIAPRNPCEDHCSSIYLPRETLCSQPPPYTYMPRVV